MKSYAYGNLMRPVFILSRQKQKFWKFWKFGKFISASAYVRNWDRTSPDNLFIFKWKSDWLVRTGLSIYDRLKSKFWKSKYKYK